MFIFTALLSELMSGAIKCIKFIPTKLWIALLLIGVLAGGYFYHVHAVKAAYEDGFAQGVYTGKKQAEEEAEIQRQAEAQRIETVLAEQRKGQQAIVEELESKLQDKEQELMAKAKIQIKEVIKYVTKESDDRAIIPAGFVYVHQMSTTTDPDSVAPSKPNDVDAPTTVTLSEIARTDTANNAECQIRSEVIDSWIEWYERNKALWEHTIKLQEEKIVVH